MGALYRDPVLPLLRLGSRHLLRSRRIRARLPVPDNVADFDAKALEASNARLWGGIHWREDNEVGLDVGRQVGNLVVERARGGGAGRG